MSVGLGGTGSKLAGLLSNGSAAIIDVSDTDLEKTTADNKLRAVVHSSRAQMRGSRKDPLIGREAFQSVRDKLLEMVRGNIVFSAAGGGTGNGLCSELLEYLSEIPAVDIVDKTMFVFVLPYADREASDFIDNSISFLEGPISSAIDGGNTGNIVLFSNQHKFQKRIPEKTYNEMIITSLNQFLDIPKKGEQLEHLDGNIDHEDFTMYKAKPYFNHFCQFHFDPEVPFGTQLKKNYNKLLLKPDGTIEALFLLELPNLDIAKQFYGVIDYFAEENVSPVYSVLHNPNLKRPLITVSILYSRKPLELVDTYNAISGKHKRHRVKKSLDQFVTLSKLEVDLTNEARKVFDDQGSADGDEILNVLKRIGKL